MKSRYIALIPFLFLIIFPFIFWGNSYFIGGDDSHLYYIFPLEYLTNYVPRLIGENQLGSMGFYFSQLYILPFTLLILLLKNIFSFLNVQILMYSFNLAFGYLFFYKFLGIWLKNDNRFNIVVKIISSILYITSIFNYFTLWSNQLFSVYFISVTPAALYLFIKSLFEKNYYYIVICALLISLFSILLFSTAWLFAMLLALLPLFIFLGLKFKSQFISHSFFLIFIILLLNSYWLFHFFYSSISSDKQVGDLISQTISAEFKKSNSEVIKGVGGSNEVLYPLFNLFHKKIQLDFNMNSFDTYKWYLKLLPFNSIFLLVIIISSLFLSNQKPGLKKIYFISLSSWIMALYFYTANIGNWGLNLFLLLNNYIPGFVMFRNMYDKFALPLAFSFSFILSISLVELGKVFISQRKFILIIIFILTILNSKPFIFGEYFKVPYPQTSNIFNRSTPSNIITKRKLFNKDFEDLLKYIKHMPDKGRYLWLPLNTSNYIVVKDENLNNYAYIGVSPLLFLTGKSDFNGLLSFYKWISDDIYHTLSLNDYNQTAKLLQSLNIAYIIENNDIPEELKITYLYDKELLKTVEPGFKHTIYGEKIKSFGNRYEIYRINKKYISQKVYIDNPYNNSVRLKFTKVGGSEYRIIINNLNVDTRMVFLEPYHKQWDLAWTDTKEALNENTHNISNGYLNGWVLQPSFIKSTFPNSYYVINRDGSINLDLTIYFKPQKYSKYFNFLSILTLFLCLVSVIYSLFKSNVAKKI